MGKYKIEALSLTKFPVEAVVMVAEPEPDVKIVMKKNLPINRDGKFVFTTQEGGEHKVSQERTSWADTFSCISIDMYHHCSIGHIQKLQQSRRTF